MNPSKRKWPSPRWLYPETGITRWLLILAGGMSILSLGLAYLLITIYRQQPLPAVAYYLTLQFAPRHLRAALLLLIGSGVTIIALYQLNRSLRVALNPTHPQATAVATTEPCAERRGPRIVALGGGHGLSSLLRGLKYHTDHLTAIVTVADDGGSSGVLRREMGLLPPGDLRDCIAALAEAEPLMTQLFQYRFGRGAGLDGHAFGNLFIAAMAGITGDFESAISEAGRVLAVRGRILPSSLDNVTLCAEIHDREALDSAPCLIYGQSAIARAGGKVERVYLQPGNAKGYPEAIRALLHADMIVLGPGSLYTSVLPNLLVTDIANAIRASRALKVYVCNVATQPGETDSYTVGDHVRAIREHFGGAFCDYVLANGNTDWALPPSSGSAMVQPQYDGSSGGQLILEDLVDRELPWRHDPVRLATALMRLYDAHRATTWAE